MPVGNVIGKVHGNPVFSHAPTRGRTMPPQSLAARSIICFSVRAKAPVQPPAADLELLDGEPLPLRCQAPPPLQGLGMHSLAQLRARPVAVPGGRPRRGARRSGGRTRGRRPARCGAFPPSRPPSCARASPCVPDRGPDARAGTSPGSSASGDGRVAGFPPGCVWGRRCSGSPAGRRRTRCCSRACPGRPSGWSPSLSGVGTHGARYRIRPWPGAWGGRWTIPAARRSACAPPDRRPCPAGSAAGK